jgi:ribosomal protein S18 acetylase RimI-like enzyme
MRPQVKVMFWERRDVVQNSRPVMLADADAVHWLLERAWRTYLRFPAEDVRLHLQSGLGWVVDGEHQVSGFMLAEVQPSCAALITAAAVSDGRQLVPHLDALLRHIEETARQIGATALSQIGYAPWLTGALDERGFATRDWVITYEWQYQPVSVRGNLSVTVRPAQHRDLPTLLAMDASIFGPVWHKPIGNFEDALARAFNFTVAEQDGRLIGYQWSDKRQEHGHITRLAVRPEWENRGVGTRLLTESMTAMVKAGAAWITLNTQESNLRSRRLYEHYGFRLVDQRVAVLWKDL